MTGRPLAGDRVVEWTTGAAGAFLGKLLAGFGAEVIKVEPPTGDPLRRQPPFAGDRPDPDRGLLFLYLNTGKRSVALDVTRPAGRAIFEDLVGDAAILIEDHRPADLAALGLGYDFWAAGRPDLIVASITPFGQFGPRASDRAYPLTTHLAGGESYTLAGSLTGLDRPPTQVGSRTGDLDTGTSGLIATLAALYSRDVTGLGQQLDISAEETALALSRVIHGRQTVDGVVESRRLRQRRPGGLVRCRDGYVEIVLVTDEAWAAVCRVIGRPELAGDERYATWYAREPRALEINTLLEDWAVDYDKSSLAHLLQEHHIPGGAYSAPDEVAASPQYAHRAYFQPVAHPVAGTAPYPTVPYRFSELAWEMAGPAPRLGADTDSILGDRLGRSAAELATLRSAGVIR